MIRNTPDTEEAKNMIYPESIKIITHFLKALLPPCETIFTHLLPVISRETPVLTRYSKIIRWRSCLYIHMIKLRVLPCISTIAVYADWNISFQNNSIIMCILCSLFQMHI